MTRIPCFTRQFRRDVKNMRKRGKDLKKLESALSILIEEDRLDVRFDDHALIGNFKGRRECHIEPDWLLIYKITGREIIFERTGAHSDLFE